MLAVGDRIYHSRKSGSFGYGTILLINEKKGSVLVRWESHEVNRETKGLSKNETHVGLSNVVKA